jgi:phosphoglycerol transferase MdoB-like AlkP superfamily enzyme
MPSNEITFANVWGVCDEDIFKRVVREADADYAAGRPFLQQVMTVSNHRPFTYPDGKIDIPSTYGRDGGIKYADYAVGRLIELAKTKPWFKDTLFVFVADHTASSAGRIELDPQNYHIPAIFYAPAFVQPRKIDHLVSQVDIAPSILGILNLSYRSRFIGEDQIDGPPVARAFISNFEKLGLIEGKSVAILGPKREVKGYVDEKPVDESKLDKKLLLDAITYYQFSSHWKERFKRVDSILTN